MAPSASRHPLGTTGAAHKPQAEGIPHFSSTPLQGASSLPFSRQTPGHPRQPLHICIMSLRKHDVLFPVTHSLSFFISFFLFLKAQRQLRTEQKPSACSLPHPSSELENNLLPLPKSQQQRACFKLNKEAFANCKGCFQKLPLCPSDQSWLHLNSCAALCAAGNPLQPEPEQKNTGKAEKAPELVSTTFSSK